MGRDRPTCGMSGCGETANWIALGEERLGDEYIGPSDVPLCDAHTLEILTGEDDEDADVTVDELSRRRRP